MKSNVKKSAAPIVLLLDGVLLLCMPKAAAQAAREGLQLCIEVVIPSLFPFLVLSSMLVSTGAISALGRSLEGVTRRVLHLDGSCAAVLAVGLVGGFPVGARTAARMYEDGQCSKDEAERMLAFCNNCGPAFVFGFAGSAVLGSARAGLMLYISQIIGALLVALLTRPNERGCTALPPAAVLTENNPRPSFPAALTQAVRSSFGAIGDICAFVLFFAVTTGILRACGAFALASGMLCKLNVDPAVSNALLLGVFEVSAGVAALGDVAQPEWVRLALCSAIMGWSGLSVHCQVISVTEDAGLSVKRYMRGKMLHCAIAAAAAAAMGLVFPAKQAVTTAGFAPGAGAAAACIVLPAILLIVGIKDKNRSGNGAGNGV